MTGNWTRGVLVGLALGMLGMPSLHAADRPVRMLFVGDILLGHRMTAKMQQYGTGYPSQHVQSILRDADFVFGNLECPLTTHAVQTPGKPQWTLDEGIHFVFKADPRLASDALTKAGFTAVSVANNHAMDYCGEGLLETLEVLEDADIIAAGGGKDWDTAAAPRIVTVEGHRIGILACSMINPPHSGAGENTPGTYAVAKGWNPFLEEQLNALERKCDFVIFTVHWGIEGSTAPAKYQQIVAKAALAAGADVVIGHHTHCLQTFEWVDDELIAYSLGNFIFPGKSKLLPSAILELNWYPSKGTYDAELHPVLVRDGVPEPTTDKAIRQTIAALAPDVPLVAAPVQSR